MRSFWPVVIVIIVGLAAAALYYSGILTTPNLSEVQATSTEVLKDDFLFTVSVDKSVYRYDEPIVIHFNLTYVGEIPHVYSLDKANSPFYIMVRNATNDMVRGDTRLTGGTGPHNFTNGGSVTGMAMIAGGRFDFETGVGGGGVLPFTPGGTYEIQGRTYLIKPTGTYIDLVSPSVTILITE